MCTYHVYTGYQRCTHIYLSDNSAGRWDFRTIMLDLTLFLWRMIMSESHQPNQTRELTYTDLLYNEFRTIRYV